MNRITLTSYGVLLSLALVLPAAAQNKNDKKQSKPGAKAQSRVTDDVLSPEQQMALSVLDQLIESVKTLDDVQLKFRTQAQVADILWPYDETRSRRLFEETFRAIAQAKLDKQIAVPAGLTAATASPLSQLQDEVLSLITRRDANLAEKLINSIVDATLNKEADSVTQRDKLKAERSGFYLQAAISIADTNPERAMQLAKASLAGGINPAILRVLFALRQKNPAQANALYRSMLAAARGDIKRASVNILILASYALPEFTTSAVGLGPTQSPGAPSQTDSAMVTEFLNFVYDIFMRLSDPAQVQSANPVDYMTGQRLLPFFVQHSPDRAPLFRNMLEMISQRSSQTAAVDMVNKMLQPAETDELLKQAETTRDPLQRDMLYFRAIMTLAGSGEFERALSLVEKINDSDFRNGLDSLVHFQAASSLLDKGDIDSAIRYVKSMSDVRQRAFMLARIARTLFNKKETARASEILKDAEQMIRKADEGAEKAQALLIITEIQTRLDPMQGFEVMEATVEAFNDADFKTDDKTKPAPSADFSLSSMLTIAFNLEMPDFAPSFSLLARTDFNRALLLAQTLKKKDRAVLAQLAVCRSALSQSRNRKT